MPNANDSMIGQSGGLCQREAHSVGLTHIIQMLDWLQIFCEQLYFSLFK